MGTDITLILPPTAALKLHKSSLGGRVIWADREETEVTPEQFQTTEPHCGFCTVFLIAAGLPVGKPTCGNYNLAGRLAYQLPEDLETSPQFMARVMDGGTYCGFAAVKRVLNAFVNAPPDKWVLNIDNLAYVDDASYIVPDSGLLVVDWRELVNQFKRDVLYLAWKEVFTQLLKSNV